LYVNTILCEIFGDIFIFKYLRKRGVYVGIYNASNFFDIKVEFVKDFFFGVNCIGRIS